MNDRDRLVEVPAVDHVRTNDRNRRVARLEAFTAEEMAVIAQSAVPAEHAHLDAELEGWTLRTEDKR